MKDRNRVGRRGFREVPVSSSRGEERHSGRVAAGPVRGHSLARVQLGHRQVAPRVQSQSVLSVGRTIMVSADWERTIALSANSRDTSPKSSHR